MSTSTIRLLQAGAVASAVLLLAGCAATDPQRVAEGLSTTGRAFERSAEVLRQSGATNWLDFIGWILLGIGGGGGAVAMRVASKRQDQFQREQDELWERAVSGEVKTARLEAGQQPEQPV